MQTQALTRSSSAVSDRQFNPSHFNSDALELMQVNPQLAANSMTKLAIAKRAAEREANISKESQSDLLALLVSNLLVAGLGMWDGKVMAKRDEIILGFESQGVLTPGEEPTSDLFEAQGIKEPGRILGPIPMGIAFAGLFGAAAIGLAIRRDENAPAGTLERIMAVTATTTLGVWVANKTRAIGYRREQAAMVAAAAQSQMTGT